MFCSSCGKQVSSKARFCSSCGSSTAPDRGCRRDGFGRRPDRDWRNARCRLRAARRRSTRRVRYQRRRDVGFAGASRARSNSSARRVRPLGRDWVRAVPAPAPSRVPKYSTPRVPRPPSASAGTLSSSDAIGGGRFVPGQIIADRYRIVALAGRGGMGEVYRAEDLKLSQIVAIKFLPESVSQDAAALARFHAEVRIARTVSHPNVCRMFDIGDMDGITFLTMEYVDGEDLSSLVRRIGRLSTDKAAEIARQMCAGLGRGSRQRRHSSRFKTREHHARRRGESSHHGFRLGWNRRDDRRR